MNPSPISCAPFRGYIEFRTDFSRPRRIGHVIFDFDGTLSLIRQGWQDIMVPMFVEMLPRMEGDTEESVRLLMLDDITRLTGKQTIYQMIQFAERVKERGGNPEEPMWYKTEYLRRLNERISGRLDGLRSKRFRPDNFLVFGARQLLESLKKLGVTMYLASGTDEPSVKEEAVLLDVAKYFEPHIYGALDDLNKFSKKMVIDRILRENAISGNELLAFGDGYVELEDAKGVGGTAVAVATDEEHNGSGRIDDWKRERLLAVGADIVIADYRDSSSLLGCLFGETFDEKTAGEKKKLEHGKITVHPLASRKSMSGIDEILMDPAAALPEEDEETGRIIRECAERIQAAYQKNATVMLIYGAHLIKNGGQLLIRDFMKKDWITHVATNGAGTIHDWEFSWHGRSTESVRTNVATGTFGTWDETGKNIHLALLAGGIHGEGYGEALGRFIAEDGTVLPSMESLEEAIRSTPSHPLTPARAELLYAMRTHGLSAGRYGLSHAHKHSSVLCEAYLQGVRMTVHPGIGYDIITNHPMFSGASLGRAAHIDFQYFAQALDNLDGGVVLSVGSAIMGPQVFEKAMSCVNNIRIHEGRSIVAGHSIYVVDLQEGGRWDWSRGEPPKDNAAYYLRFCKSFARMGGRMQYLECDNVRFLHRLHRELISLIA